MATYATDLLTVNLCDSATGWTELSGHTSGQAPDVDTENFIHNANSISQATNQATGTSAGMQYDYGSNITWTSGHVFMAWQYYAAPTNLYSWSSGGMRIGIGSSAGNMRFWNALGDDFGDYPYGGWQNTAIDPEVTGDATDGTPQSGNYRYFGSLPNVRAKITKGTPHAVDAIRYGRGQLKVTGTGANFSGMASANDASTARWGLFQYKAGSYLWKGLMSLGLSGTSVTFSDSNKTVRVDDTPRVSSGFNKIEINNSGSSVTLSGITIQGVQTSITGSAPVSPGDIEVVDNATIDFDSCIFVDLGTIVFNGGTNDNTVDDCIFRRCGQVTQSGAKLTNCVFDKAESSVSLVVDSLGDVSKCTFNSDGSNHAINLGTISSDTSMNCNNYFNNYATSNGSTGNEVILVNVASGVTLTINKTGGDTPTYYNTGSGTVSVVASFDHVITGLEQNTEVTYVTAGTSNQLFHVENASVPDGDGKYKTTYTHSGGATVDILIHHINYKPDISNIIGITLPSANATIKVQMFPDENYYNP